MNKPADQRGQITSWKDGRGFGFITPNSGGDEVFVHISAFENRSRRPVEGEAVIYQVKTDDKGRAQAHRVNFVGEGTKRSSKTVVYGR